MMMIVTDGDDFDVMVHIFFYRQLNFPSEPVREGKRVREGHAMQSDLLNTFTRDKKRSG